MSKKCLSPMFDDRMSSLIRVATTMLSSEEYSANGRVVTFEEAVESAGNIKRAALEKLRSVQRGDERVTPLRDLALLAIDLEIDLEQESKRQHKTAVLTVEAVFERLRHVEPGQLLVRACSEIIECTGFSRVMLSHVESEVWVPRVIYTRSQGFSNVCDNRITLGLSTVEAHACRSFDTIRVIDTEGDSRVSPELLKVFVTRSYAVAPIAPAGKIIGMLHVDHGASLKTVSTAEQRVLEFLAMDISQAYEWSVLVERVRLRKASIDNFLKDFEPNKKTIEGSENNTAAFSILSWESQERLVSSSRNNGAETEIKESLTHREREILSFVVQGWDNRSIAEELVLVEGTVKSHVKHLLRKYGAVNRSELISRCLQGG